MIKDFGLAVYSESGEPQTESEQGNDHLFWILTISLEQYREGNGTPLQYSCLENPMDRGAW